ncbi:hypothetical protein H1P_660025 [Hyella patelloides LEGE 07179]|uniref:Uncharacterized protein n=1 Tax=Hyella patelloides LEGE 07179 TaxID=945734 RepID=A0A563W2R4_9CYAN|nr:hypothetical protein H1P_660025 [Hyella patelloides LEGE 07179]
MIRLRAGLTVSYINWLCNSDLVSVVGANANPPLLFVNFLPLENTSVQQQHKVLAFLRNNDCFSLQKNKALNLRRTHVHKEPGKKRTQ